MICETKEKILEQLNSEIEHLKLKVVSKSISECERMSIGDKLGQLIAQKIILHGPEDWPPMSGKEKKVVM